MYPRPLRLLIACWMVAAMWALLALFFLVLFAGLAGFGSDAAMGRVLQAILVSGGVLVPLQITVTLGLRCPACRGWATLETFRPFHPAARVTMLGGRYAAVVLDVLRERRFTCMYCGREHRLGH